MIMIMIVYVYIYIYIYTKLLVYIISHYIITFSGGWLALPNVVSRPLLATTPLFGGSHLSSTTRLTNGFFKSGEERSALR